MADVTIASIGAIGREVKVFSFNTARASSVQFASDKEDEVADVIPLPAKTLAVRMSARICGDFYAEIEGKRFVAGFGDTPEAAFRMALGKAA